MVMVRERAVGSINIYKQINYGTISLNKTLFL